MYRILSIFFLLLVLKIRGVIVPVTVNFARNSDEVPLLKKYAIYNSGIVGQDRYTPDVIASMGLIKAASLRIDLSIGKAGSGFTELMSGNLSSQEHRLNFNFSLIDTLAEGLQLQKVMPYWGLSYNPYPFQPVCAGGLGSQECQNSTTTCRGFEDQAAVPGTNNYTCVPFGSSIFDDCWKCPPKSADDGTYTDWGQMVAYFHSHFLQKNITPLYEEHWNEPDLTEYYNPTLASFKGSAEDYNEAYSACALALLEIDSDVVFGGMAAAKQIFENPDYPKQPTQENTLLAAAANELPMDFFSYHSITTDPGADQVALLISRAQQSRDVLSSEKLANITGSVNPYVTTEIHCNEFYPNSTTESLSVDFSGSAYMASLLLEIFNTLLDETDISAVHWAQYMDVFNNTEQIGLLDFSGNPRPAWWSYRWYAELPTERVNLELDSPFVRGIAAFSERESAGGILIWSIPNPRDGQPAKDTIIRVSLKNVPFQNFRLEAYIIDDRKQPGEGFSYDPAKVLDGQKPDQNGTYVFPSTSYAGLRVPVNGTIYLKLTPTGSPPALGNSGNVLPTVQILRTHHYYPFRPLKTSLYAHFHPRDWSAYLGMGHEDSGFAITGATFVADIRGQQASVLNISMHILDGEIAEGGIAGIRMDFSATVANANTASYQQSASYFFYQNGSRPCSKTAVVPMSAPAPQALDLSAGAPPQQAIQGQRSGQQSSTSGGGYLFASQNSLSTSVAGRKLLSAQTLECGFSEEGYVQVPDLWGTKKAVWGNSFVPVELSDFVVDTAALAPTGWDGRIMLLFVLKDGSPATKARIYVTKQPGSL